MDLNLESVPVVRLLKRCPICESKRTRPIRTEKNVFFEGIHPDVGVFTDTWSQLLKCLDCGFAFTKEIPVSPTFFVNRYDNSWYDPEHEVGSSRKSEILEDIFQLIKKNGKSSGALLDVGSFAGKLMTVAKEKGYPPEGIEINPKLANYSREKLGFTVYCGEFQKIEVPSNHYEVVTIIDVLEHLVDPKVVLVNLSKSMKEGALLVIKVPYYPMQILKQSIANFLRISDAGMFTNFAHINHFSVRSMKKALDLVGLDLVEVQMARSEEWGSDKSLYWFRNFLRFGFWHFSRLVYSLTGILIAFNANYIAKKR